MGEREEKLLPCLDEYIWHRSSSGDEKRAIKLQCLCNMNRIHGLLEDVVIIFLPSGIFTDPFKPPHLLL